MVFNVTNVDDGIRSTKWNGISIATEDGTFTANIPWIEVTAGLTGGHTMTFAETSDFRYADPKKLAYQNIAMDISNVGLEVKVTGDEGNRDFNSSFDKISFKTKPGGLLKIDGDVTGGTTIINKSSGDVNSVDARFDYENMNLVL